MNLVGFSLSLDLSKSTAGLASLEKREKLDASGSQLHLHSTRTAFPLLIRTGASLFIPKDDMRRDAFRIASVIATSIDARETRSSFFFFFLIS